MIWMFMATGLASAQDVVVESFDPPALVWTDTSPIHTYTYIPMGYFAVGDPTWYGLQASLGSAGVVGGNGGGNYNTGSGESSAFRVTHQTLAFDLQDGTFVSGYLVARRAPGGYYVADAGAQAANVWEHVEIDVAQACGREVALEFSCYSDYGNAAAVDDITFTGTVCSQYLDADADGVCPMGYDLDGDGACVGSGEPSNGEVLDCDSGVFGVDCLGLTATQPRRGSTMRVTVWGATPGETVRVVTSQVAGSTCLAKLGGLCLDLDAIAGVVNSGVANADGVAVVNFAIPVTFAYMSEVYVQAVVRRGPGGADSAKSSLSTDYVAL